MLVLSVKKCLLGWQESRNFYVKAQNGLFSWPFFEFRSSMHLMTISNLLFFLLTFPYPSAFSTCPN